MSELSLKKLVKIYPFKKPEGLFFGRKKAREILERQRSQPYTTNEGVLAVQNFNLEVEHGEFIVLLGPSGCGKSTVLRMIAGLEEVSDGEVEFEGEVINHVTPDKRNIAMIFQNYSLYPNYTVYENMAFPLKNQHIPREEIDRQVKELAETLELSELLDRRPKDMSGGQRQRVAIGRALIRRPKLFLMDEPFSNLDPSLRQKLRVEVKKLHKQLDTTFIYVTHDQMEAFALGDRIVVMKDGLIEQTGTPQELFNRPCNLYTASFIGTPSMNVIRDVPLSKTGAGWQVTLFGKNFILPKSKTEKLKDSFNGNKVILGIRPVHVEPSEQGIEAAIEHTDIVEGERHIFLRVGDNELISVIPASKRWMYHKGQSVTIEISPNRFHLFDSETEENIL